MSDPTKEKAGSSPDNPVFETGDFYQVLEALMAEDENVYVMLSNMVVYLDVSKQILKLVRVLSEDRTTILSAIAQNQALAQEFAYTSWVEETLLNARFSGSE